MSDDPYRLWREKQGRRVRRGTIILIILGVASGGTAAGAIAWYRMMDLRAAVGPGFESIATLVSLSLLVPFGIMAIVYLTAIRDLWRERRLVDLVPLHDGRICAGCRAVLQGGEGTCVRCGAEWTATGLREHWEAYATGSVHRTAWSMRRGIRGVLGRFVMRVRENRRNAILFQLGVLAVMVAVFSMVSSSSILSTLMSMSWMIFFFAGCAFFGGARAHVGGTCRCAGCRYEMAPGNKQPRCPECGAEWTLLGGTVRGDRPKPSRAATLIGLACFAVAFALMAPRMFFGQGWLTSKLPTAMLIDAVTNKPGFTMDEWAELAQRPLTGAQHATLADGLLDRRARVGMTSPDDDAWFVDAVTTGTLPAPVVERFYAEMIRVVGWAPRRARAGERVELSVDLSVADPLSQKQGMHVAVAAVRVNGVLQANRSGHAATARMLPEGDGVWVNRYADPSLTIEMPSAPGDVRVSVTLWLAYMPSAEAETPLVWPDDGTPVVPATAAWSGVQTVEHVIRVLPRE